MNLSELPFYTVRQKIAPFLLVQYITLQNYAILWKFLAHRCTLEYPITWLLDSICKIENWAPAYQICYCLLISRQKRKKWKLPQRDTPDFITPDLWPPNSPDLNPVDNGVLQERVYQKSVKNWTLMNWSGFWLKDGWHPAKCHKSDNSDQWRVCLNACVKANGKHFEHMLWCAVPQLSIICYETYIQFFVSQLLTSHDF